jgi:DNA-binding NarL/FixJ family response regulator
VSDPIRIVIIDDQALVRAGLAMLLEAEPDIVVVGQAGDGQEGLALIRAEHPDVALMDVRMPVMDGIATTERVVLDGSLTTKVLILTTYDTDRAVLDAVRVGASGFLLKDAQPDDIIRAVRAVHDGDAVMAPAATRRLLAVVGPGLRAGALNPGSSTVAPPSGSPSPPGPTAAVRKVPAKVAAAVGALTEREREVLTLVGRGLTNSEIAAALFLSEATVKTHVHRIMGKLSARDRVQAVLIAHSAGLVDQV